MLKKFLPTEPTNHLVSLLHRDPLLTLKWLLVGVDFLLIIGVTRVVPVQLNPHSHLIFREQLIFILMLHC